MKKSKEPAGEKWRDHLPCGQLKEKTKQIQLNVNEQRPSCKFLGKSSLAHALTHTTIVRVLQLVSKNYFHNNRIKNNTRRDLVVRLAQF